MITMANFYNEYALNDLIECNRKKMEIVVGSGLEHIQDQIHHLRKNIDKMDWTDAIIVLTNIERQVDKLNRRVKGVQI